jgi:hypothetical protein
MSVCFSFSALQVSEFQIKGDAGNIVHAIASSNAIVGGLIVQEAVKLILGQTDKCKYHWYVRVVRWSEVVEI